MIFFIYYNTNHQDRDYSVELCNIKETIVIDKSIKNSLVNIWSRILHEQPKPKVRIRMDIPLSIVAELTRNPNQQYSRN